MKSSNGLPRCAAPPYGRPRLSLLTHRWSGLTLPNRAGAVGCHQGYRHADLRWWLGGQFARRTLTVGLLRQKRGRGTVCIAGSPYWSLKTFAAWRCRIASRAGRDRAVMPVLQTTVQKSTKRIRVRHRGRIALLVVRRVALTGHSATNTRICTRSLGQPSHLMGL